MDPAIRDTMFAGLTLRDIAEALVLELKRRNCFGCFYAIPAGENLYGTFTAAMPAGCIHEMPPEQILDIFSQVAALGTNRVVIPGDVSPAQRKPN